MYFFKNHLEYGTNINIAEYKDGVRLTLNGKGRVYPDHIKEHLSLGRSVQFVNPQTFDNRVWYLCEVLQELFGCFVGANTYLTPPGSAGFAPHWDEIDAFLLQLEGRKYWKVYAPDSRDNELPREPSGNFNDEDMKNRKPTFEGWIEAGDLLYIPRGFIHNATTDDNVHSLHITISSGRLWTFADLLEKLVPEAVSTLAKNRWKMRKSLPVGMLDMNGVAEIDYRLEEHFEDGWKSIVDRHMTALRNSLREVCDGGIDLMARAFMRTALPPLLTPEEKLHSVMGCGTDILNGAVMEFRPSTKVKLIRRHAQRLLFESEDSCYIAHRMANSRLYEGLPEQTFELPVEFVSGFNALSNSYPEWMSLSEMPEEMNGAEVQALLHYMLIAFLITTGLITLQGVVARQCYTTRKGKQINQSMGDCEMKTTRIVTEEGDEEEAQRIKCYCDSGTHCAQNLTTFENFLEEKRGKDEPDYYQCLYDHFKKEIHDLLLLIEPKIGLILGADRELHPLRVGDITEPSAGHAIVLLSTSEAQSRITQKLISKFPGVFLVPKEDHTASLTPRYLDSAITRNIFIMIFLAVVIAVATYLTLTEDIC
nr:Cupin 4 domain containing protein [Haemonchus contortus]